MLTPTSATWIVRGATFVLWALAAGSAAYWGLKLASAAPVATTPAPASRQVGPVDPVAIARLLGSTPAAAGVAAPAAPALASRLQLIGVAAAAASGGGAAVIAVDGKPPRAYRVGSVLVDDFMLQSVQGRRAVVASQRDGQPVLTLEMPVARPDAGRPGMPAVPPSASMVPQPPPYTPPVPQIAPQPAPGMAPQAATEAPR